MRAESRNRRHAHEGAYTEVRNRMGVPHVAAICAQICPRYARAKLWLPIFNSTFKLQIHLLVAVAGL